jgi:hypothetical protein
MSKKTKKILIELTKKEAKTLRSVLDFVPLENIDKMCKDHVSFIQNLNDTLESFM